MVFSSAVFLFVFLPIILVGYYGVANKTKYRNIFLLLVRLIFYAWGEPTYVLLMILSICANYRIGLIISSQEEGDLKLKALWAGVFFNLALLFIFKYETFITTNINTTLASYFPIRVSGLGLPLPIGISFFTFQAISYLVDVYRGQAEVQKSLINLGLYISFFPQLIAGPIVRYTTIEKQINERTTTYSKFTQGVKGFIIGMGKKIILANQFALIATESFEHTSPSVAFAWIGALCYSLQIYYDFSGYSDMAIGLGKMFGFDFPKNFNYPYISGTITEFWRRWHISLGSWFRDYVYIPLGGSRVNKKRLVFNLLVVWLLTGVWHGAAYQFIVWGLLYFALLTVEKLLNIPSKMKYKLFAIPYRMFTLLMVLIGWVIFGESTLVDGVHHIKIMFLCTEQIQLYDQLSIRAMNNDGILLVLGIILCTPILKFVIEKLEGLYEKQSSIKISTLKLVQEHIGSFIYMLVFFISLSYLVIGAHNPFIYFNF